MEDRERSLQNLREVASSLQSGPIKDLDSAATEHDSATGPDERAGTGAAPAGTRGAPQGVRRIWARWGWLGILIAAALSKLKLAFGALKLLKLTSLITMFVSIYAYSTIWGWAFAAGFVLLIVVHELGHGIVMRMQGIPAGAPTFIPFVGAVIAMMGRPRNALVEAKVAFGGPVVGSLAALGCVGLWWATKSDLWRSLAYAGFMINLFNLLPISPLDGGRIVGAIGRWLWIIGFAIGIPLFLKTHSPILFLVLLIGLAGLFGRRHEPPGYFEIANTTRRVTAVAYFALVGALAWGMTATHLPTDIEAQVERRLSEGSAEDLAVQGHQHLELGEYAEAREVAAALEEREEAAGYWIRAEVFNQQEEYRQAIEVLEQGVLAHPEEWQLWQFLGNCRGSSGAFAAADSAYEAALSCPDVHVGSVHLNQCISSLMREDYLTVLSRTREIEDESLAPHFIHVRILALMGVGSTMEAERLLDTILASNLHTEDPQLWGSLVATQGRLHLSTGHADDEVRVSMISALKTGPPHEEVFGVLRMIDELVSEDPSLYQLQITGETGRDPVTRRTPARFSVNHVVAADSETEAFQLASQLETSLGGRDLKLLHCVALEQSLEGETLKGVYWRADRVEH